MAGRDLNGVHYALEFLTSQNRVNDGEIAEPEVSAKDKKVLIVGGGDTGSDCMGTAFRQGAKSVTQVEIMPEPPLERHSSTPWPDWPYKLRTSSSHLEGGTRMWGVNVKEIHGSRGMVKSATLTCCDWRFDSAGRPKSFAERPNSKFKIEADLVLLSMGFTGVDTRGVVDSLGVMLTPRGTIGADSDCATNIEGVFAAGDSVSGPSLVVRAIQSGKNLARCVDSYLKKLIK